ncbi:aminotransferase class V-fold PLP-dependent enzyme [Mangrovihabitans endophyticus]|uniref:Cysteine desulfurase n=1 Tax=Mangrovihabitans endophyticus TaxID=1751298 RepID=A0A8J3BWH6_9ACTN|nr:aminotransferase class V-fold PLP-dependent enzyme [Mangrovihabitans endophyticus]GGK76054.1 cysteine desulfurase [Mangrovihabitans endophyticus]
MAVPSDLIGWHKRLREQFPIITGNPDVAYLDSAATSQKPQAVLDAVLAYLSTGNANAARGTYPWANRTTARIEHARERLCRFLDDPEPRRSGVHFVSGATEGLRAIATDWLAPQLRDGDQIIVPFADHAANIEPWLEVVGSLRRLGVRVQARPMPYDAAFDYEIDRLADMLDERTRLIVATQVHHVYGNDMNVHRLRAVAGPHIPICVDAAQAVGHVPVSLAGADVDFLVFSGHKTMALPGTGAVWAGNRRGPRFAPAGWHGSPNTAGIISMTAALDWLDAAGTERIARWNTALAARLTEGLRWLPSFEILGCQGSLAAGTPVQQRVGIVTFRHRSISSNDLGFVLAAEGLMVRADGHCQGDAGEKTASVRVSLHVYNSVDEVDRLLAVLADIDHT